jgi:spore coat assembly protein
VQPESKVRAYKEEVYRDCQRKLNYAKTYGARSQTYATRMPPWLKKGFYRDTANEREQSFKRPGKVLHLDGDQDYLETCLKEYKKRGIDAIGKHVQEREQPSYVYRLLQEHKPDILVLTGHDGISKDQKNYSNINSYINSRYFIEAVKEARRFNVDMDGLVIFAGACQSMYDGILKAGANFASAPHRVLIHALDPVMVTEKLAFTSVDRVIMPLDVINNTITGLKGIGGLQTRGKFRNGYPKEPYND